MKQKRHHRIGICIVTCLLVLVIYMFFSCFRIHHMEAKQIKEKTQNYIQRNDIAPKHATVFFGDSITEWCPLEDLYGEYIKDTGVSVINRGISNEKTDTMLTRLDQSALVLEPRNLVMLMGINDVLAGVKKETIISNIKEMIELTKKKSPKTHIILQSIYPMNRKERPTWLKRIQGFGKSNAYIKEINKELKQLAKEEDITFVDVFDALLDDEGNLSNAYAYDGLHPNTCGYRVIRAYILAELE